MDKLLPHQLFRMKAKIKEMTENSYKPFLRSSKLLGEADLIKKANFKGNNTSQICGSFFSMYFCRMTLKSSASCFTCINF